MTGVDTWLDRSSRTSKRAFDLTVAVLGLATTAPLMGAVAVAIKMDSPGPVVFRQERVGKNGVPFRIHKFRTMHQGDGALISTSNDPRITRVGAVLRLTKLDELPQLVDVLLGTMSMVGPRPEVARYVELWPEDARKIILSVRPGLTDPASVVLRHEAEELAHTVNPEAYYIQTLLPLKTSMYKEYVRSRSFVGDLRIIGATLLALVRSPELGPNGVSVS